MWCSVRYCNMCYVAKVVYLALRWERGRHQPEAGLSYHYRALTNGKKITSLYTSQACVSVRVVLIFTSFMY